MKNKTSRGHYQKYENIAKYMGLDISYNLASKAFGYSRTSLKKEYQKDVNLNFIPLRNFDIEYRSLADKNMPQSLAENVCVHKHCLIYYFMKIKPEYND